jgi:hypothetical protein
MRLQPTGMLNSMRNIMYGSALAHAFHKKSNYRKKCLIYTVVVIDHTARVGMLYMGESEIICNKLLKVSFVGYTGHCAYRNL